MSLKSILRAVWPFRSNSGPTDLADLVRGVAPASTPFLDRLTSRRDWLQDNPRGCAACNWTGYADFAAVPCEVCQGRGLSHPLPVEPAPAVAPWVRQAVEQHNRDVVQDPGLCTIRDYAKRVNANTAELTDTIDRQEAAEKLLRIMGWQWDKNQKSWQAPNL